MSNSGQGKENKDRVTITVDPDLREMAELAVEEGRAKSVSAFVNGALRDKKRRQERAREYLAAMVDEHRLADPEAFTTSRTRAEAMVQTRLAEQRQAAEERDGAGSGGTGAAA